MTSLPSPYKWAIAIITALLGTVIALSANIDDNALDLLPDTAVKGDLLLFQKLGLVNRVIISLTVDDASEASGVAELKKSTEALGTFLQDSEHFDNVIYHLPQKFAFEMYEHLQPLIPLLLDGNDLDLLGERTTADGLESALQKSFSLLNSPAGYGLKRQIQSDPLDLTSLFFQKLKYLKAEYSLVIDDGFFLSPDTKSSLIIAESRGGLTSTDSAVFIDAILKEAFASLLEPGITPRVIGSLPHTLANAASVQHDLKTLLPVATLLLLTLLLLALKNIRALLVLVIPFLAAPSAIAVTGLIFGKISALALGFGIVLLGIAVDFSIHLYIGLSVADRTDTFLRNIRRPILLATLTTASVFIVVLFSGIPSHRQMASLALSGVLLAVLYSWYLIPLITPAITSGRRPAAALFLPRLSLPARRGVLAAWAILVFAGVMAWPNLRYNGNLQTLDAPSASVIADEEHFKKTWGGKGEQAFLVASAGEMERALQINYKIFQELRKLAVPSFQSLAPILPSIADQTENLAGWQKFWKDTTPHFRDNFLTSAATLGFAATAFDPFFDFLARPPLPVPLLEAYPEGIRILANSFIRLPEQQPGKQEDNSYLLVTTLSTNDDIYDSLLELDNENPDITLLANKKWRNQVESMLRHDIITLSLAAAVLITLITLVTFRSIRTAVAVLAPVISALSAMALFSFLTGKELNMMHLLMGIMVIGLSVDYGIFIACANDQADSTSGSTSPRAISICAMSSLIGFGVLSFAQHPALNSLGVTVLVGIGAAWPTAILVTPAIMAKNTTTIRSRT